MSDTSLLSQEKQSLKAWGLPKFILEVGLDCLQPIEIDLASLDGCHIVFRMECRPRLRVQYNKCHMKITGTRL